MELYLQSPSVFMAWDLIKQRMCLHIIWSILGHLKLIFFESLRFKNVTFIL